MYDGSVYYIDNDLNAEPKSELSLSNLKIFSIMVSNKNGIIIDNKHKCYIWRGFKQLEEIKNQRDFSYIEKIGCNDYYFAYLDFSGLLGMSKWNSKEIVKVPFDYTKEHIESFECGKNILCIIDRRNCLYLYNEEEGIFKVKLNESIQKVQIVKGQILLLSSDLKRVHIFSTSLGNYGEIKQIANISERIYRINKNCNLRILFDCYTNNSNEIMFCFESLYTELQEIEINKEKLFSLELMSDFSKQEDNKINYLVGKDISTFQSTNINSNSSFSLADSVLPVNISLTRLNSSMSSGLINANNTFSNNNTRINKITNLLERIFDNKFEIMAKRKSRSTKRRIVIERVNSSEFSHEEIDLINKTQINRVSGIELNQLNKTKIDKHQRGYSGPIQRNLQSISEEDEKTMINSLRKRQEEISKEKESINEKSAMTNLHLLKIQTKNDKKGKDRNKDKENRNNNNKTQNTKGNTNFNYLDKNKLNLIKTKVAKSELRLKNRSMVSPSNIIPNPNIQVLSDLKKKLMNNKREEFASFKKDEISKNLKQIKNNDITIKEIFSVYEKQKKEEDIKKQQKKEEKEKIEKQFEKIKQKNNIKEKIQKKSEIKNDLIPSLEKGEIEVSLKKDQTNQNDISFHIDKQDKKEIEIQEKQNTSKNDTPPLSDEINSKYIENPPYTFCSPKKIEFSSIKSPIFSPSDTKISKKIMTHKISYQRSFSPSIESNKNKNNKTTLPKYSLNSSYTCISPNKNENKNYAYVYHKAKPKSISISISIDKTEPPNQKKLIDQILSNSKNRNNIKLYTATSKESLNDLIEKAKESEDINSSIYYQIENDDNKILYIKNNNIEIITNENICSFIKKKNKIKPQTQGFSHLKQSHQQIKLDGKELIRRNKSISNMISFTTTNINKTKEPIRIIQSQSLSSFSIKNQPSKDKIDTNKEIIFFKKTQSTPAFKHNRSKSSNIKEHKSYHYKTNKTEVHSPKLKNQMRASTPLKFISYKSTSNYQRPLNHSMKNESILNPNCTKVISKLLSKSTSKKSKIPASTVEKLKERYLSYLQKIFDKNTLESITPPSFNENENDLIREFMNSEIKANDSEYLIPCESFISQDEMENFFFENLKFEKIKNLLVKKMNPGFKDFSLSTVNQMLTFDEEEKNSTLEPIELDRSSFTRMSRNSNQRVIKFNK